MYDQLLIFLAIKLLNLYSKNKFCIYLLNFPKQNGAQLEHNLEQASVSTKTFSRQKRRCCTTRVSPCNLTLAYGYVYVGYHDVLVVISATFSAENNLNPIKLDTSFATLTLEEHESLEF